MNAKRMLLKTTMASAMLPLVATGAAPRKPVPGAARTSFPNAALQTHQGKTIRFYDDAVRGNKVVLFNMMYTSCLNICPPNTAT